MVKKPKFGVIAKKSKSKLNNLISIFLIILLYIGLFYLLRGKLLFTPDFGESDAYHINTSLKFFLANQYKSNQLPFWTNLLQGGFPLIGESQIGAFFLPNYVFLKYFLFADGYNLLFIFSFFLLTCGFYLLLRSYKINFLLALILSFTLTFNGAVSFRFVHLNSLQTFSIAPILFFCIKELLEKRGRKYLIIVPILVSQMLMAGHFQVAFIVLFGIFIWFIFDYFYNSSRKWKNLKNFAIPIIFGFIIALPQIVETIVLISQSSRQFGLDYDTATSLPINWSQLISYVLPFFFGNPRFGTYPLFSSTWGIFWENTPFIGFGLFVLFLLVAFYLILSKKNILHNYLLIFGLFVLLALGNNSPLYFLFGIFPFNLFRTPPKYFYVANFFLFLYIAIIFQKFIDGSKKKLIFISLVLFFNLINILFIISNYHLLAKSSLVLAEPVVTKFIGNNKYLTLGSNEEWNKVFMKNGWSRKDDLGSYLSQKNFLFPNSNLIFNKKSVQINTGGFSLRRTNYLNNKFFALIDLKKDFFIIDPLLENTFRLYSIDRIISSKKITCDFCRKIAQIENKDLKSSIYVYGVIGSHNYQDFYMPKNIISISYLADFSSYFTKGKVSEINGLIEKKISNPINKLRINKLIYIRNKESSFEMKADFKNEGLLVIKKIVYPNLKVMVDGKKVDVYKVNLTHTGIYLTSGYHSINIEYSLDIFYRSIYIMFVALGIYLVILKLKII